MGAEHQFELSGGALCLDFVNTLEDRPLGHLEYLKRPADLVAWARQAGLVDARSAASLARAIKRRPRASEAAFEEALELRECVYRLFKQRGGGESPERRDLDRLNRHLAAALARLRLETREGRLVWGWDRPRSSPGLESILWPVVRSAAELLSSEECVRVRECASESCSWLFVDRSRTGRRKWCDMKTCGNRSKARRYYQRKKRERAGAR